MTSQHTRWRLCRSLIRLALFLLISVPHQSLAAEPVLPAGFAAPSQPTFLPDFDLPEAQGATVRSADVQGKVIVVRFWATW